MGTYPRAGFRVIGASSVQVDTGFFKTLRGILDAHHVGYRYTRSPRPKIVLKKNGATVESLSAELRSQLRSLEADFVVVEEPQTWHAGHETLIDLVTRIRPSPEAALHYPGLVPKIRMTFNPPPVGHWLQQLFEKEWAGVYPLDTFSLRDNFILNKVVDPTYLPLLLTTIPKERHPREIDGEWGTVATGVYAGYDDARHNVRRYVQSGRIVLPEGLPPFAIDPFKPLDWSLDFNVGYMASTISQDMHQQMITEFVPRPFNQPLAIARPMAPSFQPKICYVFEEIFGGINSTPAMTREFVKRFGPIARTQGVRIFGDASGGHGSQLIETGAKTNWQMIIRDLRAAGINKIEFCVQTANPPILDRVNMVREQFGTGDPEQCGFLIDADKCPETVNDFNLVQWVPGKNEIDKSDKSEDGLKRTHLSDELGYKLWFVRTRAMGQKINILDWASR